MVGFEGSGVSDQTMTRSGPHAVTDKASREVNVKGRWDFWERRKLAGLLKRCFSV